MVKSAGVVFYKAAELAHAWGRFSYDWLLIRAHRGWYDNKPIYHLIEITEDQVEDTGKLMLFFILLFVVLFIQAWFRPGGRKPPGKPKPPVEDLPKVPVNVNDNLVVQLPAVENTPPIEDLPKVPVNVNDNLVVQLPAVENTPPISVTANMIEEIISVGGNKTPFQLPEGTILTNEGLDASRRILDSILLDQANNPRLSINEFDAFPLFTYPEEERKEAPDSPVFFRGDLTIPGTQVVNIIPMVKHLMKVVAHYGVKIFNCPHTQEKFLHDHGSDLQILLDFEPQIIAIDAVPRDPIYGGGLKFMGLLVLAKFFLLGVPLPPAF